MTTRLAIRRPDKRTKTRWSGSVSPTRTPAHTLVAVIGPQGPKGEDGASQAEYVHTQTTPSSIWIIDHELGRRPNVVTFDTSGTEINGVVANPTINRATATFSVAVTGEARAI